MKLSIIVTMLCIAIINTATKCKKPNPPATDDGLPPATQTGANIFACKVNGENWISGKGIYLIGGRLTNDTLFATGSNGNNDYFDRILISINGGANRGLQYQISLNSATQLTFSTNKTYLGY